MQARSLLDLGRPGRALFVVLFLAVQLLAIAWGLRTPDHVLGFQMFNETSTINVQLFREIQRKRRRVLVPTAGGVWRAPDEAGEIHQYAWQDRVKYWPLSALDAPVRAKYGLSAQLFRLQGALDDVASHIPGDAQTKALVAVVQTSHNGRPPQIVKLRAERP